MDVTLAYHSLDFQIVHGVVAPRVVKWSDQLGHTPNNTLGDIFIITQRMQHINTH